jgi:hypothetical protein
MMLAGYALVVTVGVIYFGGRTLPSAHRQKIIWYDRFCSATKDAIRQDRIAFEAGQPAERAAAGQRFFSSAVMYHNAPSIAMCLDDQLPASPTCLLTSDWSCLAMFARTIEQALP